VVAAGGSEGKLGTPALARDRWPRDRPHLDAALRDLDAGDELLVNDHLQRVLARAEAMPRFPPRPLLYATYGNVLRMLPAERRRLTFVLVRAAPGVAPAELAARIAARTGLRARTSADFRADTVRWLLVNSEDVGDIAAMLILAMTMGFGVTGIMLYVFAFEHQRQFAVLKAIGASPRTLKRMVQAQAASCALIGTGLGLGACALAGEVVIGLGFPFRMLWFTPVLGIAGVLLVSATAAAISVRPVLKVPPSVVFAGR
jgi:putative ABC transport system permease protein